MISIMEKIINFAIADLFQLIISILVFKMK